MSRRARTYAITVIVVVLASACSSPAPDKRSVLGSAPARSASEPTSTTLPLQATTIPSKSTSTTKASQLTEPTTTVAGQPQSCQPSAFLVRVSTAQTRYALGASVPITVSISNTGPTCIGIEGSGPCQEGVAVVGESGQLVWVSNLGPYACPAMVPEAVPSTWRESARLAWSQVECPKLGSQCTEAQVLPGNYSLVGSWTVGETASKSPSLSVTISPS